MNGDYCYSWDGERYFGEFDSLEEALEDARGDRPDAKSVYIGTCTEPKLKWDSCEERIIESMLNHLGEDIGEAAEDFEVPNEDILRLGEMLDETIKNWITEEQIKPSGYAIIDDHEVKL